MANRFNLNTQSEAVVDDNLRRYMTSVFGKMFLALCMTGGISAFMASSPRMLEMMAGSGSSIILMLATFGIVIYMTARINKISTETAHILFWTYSAIMGLWLSPIFVVYTGKSIANCFFVTSTFFGGMALLGYTTKRDLTSVGNFMFVGLICLIITSFVNIIFFKSGAFQAMLSAISLIIFMGLTAYDIQKIKQFYNVLETSEISSKRAVLGALSLYMDFLNMFLAVLRLFGDRK
ncbi:MAG: Bax inhibitor-1/YccA family protein [Holosporales bacterium]|jgi:FtsH-binding integral membrane protein|nr:Bax inhibitor-1/YccA family protein [Holosporales bacterium]